jgi:hypothetical protein
MEAVGLPSFRLSFWCRIVGSQYLAEMGKVFAGKDYKHGMGRLRGSGRVVSATGLGC